MKPETQQRRWHRGLALALGLLVSPLAPAADEQSEAEVLLQAQTDKGEPQRPSFPDAQYADERRAMVEQQIIERGVEDGDVLSAMKQVPRHRFVPDDATGQAYDDGPLPIGHGQTISQPYIVAYMTELLELEPDDRVLEVGTGSAYQAAILGWIAREVVSIEIIRPLAESAAERIQRLGFENISVLHGDGYYGWPKRAPYQAIVVTAAASHVPPPLIEQLEPGGRMVIPVGRNAWTQNLLLVEKGADGEVSTRNLMAVRFVPLTGDH